MTRAYGDGIPTRKGLKSHPGIWLTLLLCGVLMATVATADATPAPNLGDPVGFFTNVASRLLSSELNLDLTRIQVYPTKQYTPAVHRLLQVTANVYDATTTNPYPSVFRPLFSRDADGYGTNVFISGFTNLVSVNLADLNDHQLDLPMDAVDLSTMSGPVINQALNVYGIPWIIGARKGFPNFNEVAMENIFQLTRRIQVTRATPTAAVSTYDYNQMYMVNLTNQLGVECWNSYKGSYTNPLTIYVTDYLKNVILTNDEGFGTNMSFNIFGALSINSWPGYNPYLPSASFQIPLNASLISITNSVYRFNPGGTPYLTTNLASPFESNVVINGSKYPQPHWWLMTTNRLRVVMLEPITSGSATNRVIDYLQLCGPVSFRDLSAEVQTWNTGNHLGYNGLWVTNLGPQSVPIWLNTQLGVSFGEYGLNSGNLFGSWGTTDLVQVENEIDAFRAFFHLSPLYNNSSGAQDVGNALTTNALVAPFTPIATVVQHISWQANDPLAHYQASDLNWAAAYHLDHSMDNLTDENLGALNQRYTPWGGNPNIGIDPYPYFSAIKDPLVQQSDDWDFPTSESLAGNWLGRVHRGTPWQTIYLKASDVLGTSLNGVNIGTNLWMNWAGDPDANDAAAMAPVQDWHLASLLASLFNTNDFRTVFSVNNPSPDAWRVLLDGLTVFTNNLDSITISSNSPQASAIASAIESTRTGQSGQFFRDVGDILATPQLTEQSPFLNGNDPTTEISDEAYEAIPSQLLSLLRADSIGSVTSLNRQVIVQFTGYDGHPYAVQVSSDLENWTNLGTNYPSNGTFSFTNSVAPGANPQFYRSVLLQ